MGLPPLQLHDSAASPLVCSKLALPLSYFQGSCQRPFSLRVGSGPSSAQKGLGAGQVLQAGVGIACKDWGLTRFQGVSPEAVFWEG